MTKIEMINLKIGDTFYWARQLRSNNLCQFVISSGLCEYAAKKDGYTPIKGEKYSQAQLLRFCDTDKGFSYEGKFGAIGRKGGVDRLGLHEYKDWVKTPLEAFLKLKPINED
jgi:hypothetical protein